MERLRNNGETADAAEYEPLTAAEEPEAFEDSGFLNERPEVPFSWMEYGIFALLGMAMLWAW